jgi:hypothetical protein
MLESIYKNSNSWIQVINVIVFVLESYIDNSFETWPASAYPNFLKGWHYLDECPVCWVPIGLWFFC